jgi:hypothetical protein
MSVDASPSIATTRQARPGLRVAALLVALAAAVGIRVALGGASVAQSLSAGLIFAGCLLVPAVSSGIRLQVRVGALLRGVAGGVVICLPVALGAPSEGTSDSAAWGVHSCPVKDPWPGCG